MSIPSTRQLLAENLKTLIAAHASPSDKPSVRAWALAKGLNVRMIDRITKEEHAITIDKLDEIALACELTAAQLISPAFGSKANPPTLLSADDRALLDKVKKLIT